jgi:hypothetical protein
MEVITMPRRDETGPDGQGPKTGRQMGDCDNAEPVFGRGMGYGRRSGFCRGFRNVKPVTFTKEEQIKILESEKVQIEKEIKELKK